MHNDWPVWIGLAPQCFQNTKGAVTYIISILLFTSLLKLFFPESKTRSEEEVVKPAIAPESQDSQTEVLKKESSTQTLAPKVSFENKYSTCYSISWMGTMEYCFWNFCFLENPTVFLRLFYCFPKADTTTLTRYDFWRTDFLNMRLELSYRNIECKISKTSFCSA